MSDNEVDDDRCAFDQALFMATAHREWRLATAGKVWSAKMHTIIMKEFYRNVLEATISEGTYLTEDDIDDFYVSTKMQFLERRKPAVEEAVVEAEAPDQAPVVKAFEAPAEAKDDSNEFISVRQLYGKAVMMSVKEAKELGIIPSESPSAPVCRVTNEDAILDEIVGEMEALNAEATEQLLQRGVALANARPGSPTEFAQAFDSAYANEIKRLTDGKRATRSATKMKKSGI